MDGNAARKIIHVDLDAFFASVEQRDAPKLKGLPVVVGGDVARGVVAAASYEARKFGIRSAMPMRQAQDRCKNLIVVPPRFDVYRAVSKQIHAVFAEHTDLIEPLSLDEAYLDVTVNRKGLPTATAVAQDIRAGIFQATGLTASAGVSGNKFLAKLGSGMNKPDGLTVIRPDRGADFVVDLPVGRFHGIGPATEARMAQLGIKTGRDLRAQTVEFLTDVFGKSGVYYRNIAWGIDDRPVVPDRERKSYGSENTFDHDLSSKEDLERELDDVLERVWEDRNRVGRDGRTLTLKVKYRDFEQITRSRSAKGLVSDKTEMREIAFDLLENLLPVSKPIRLLGVSISNLGAVGERRSDPPQMALL